MLRHRNAVHFKVRHECDICGKSYSQRGKVITHRKTAHPEVINTPAQNENEMTMLI
jgi:hypothetical protein